MGLIIIPEGEHSQTIGPSSAERALICHGSNHLPGVGEQTEYAAEGTCAHWLSEQVRELRLPPEHWKGETLQCGEFEFRVGKALIEGVRTFVDSCEVLPGHGVIEERVDYPELIEGGFGTLDDARLRDGTCVITDFKFGKGIQVSAKDNMQMKLYALGLYFKYNWIYDFDKFVMRISQPRLRHFEEDETTLGRLLQWGYDWVRPTAKLALTPNQNFKAGSHCKFCKARNTCSTRATYKGLYDRSPDEELVVME